MRAHKEFTSTSNLDAFIRGSNDPSAKNAFMDRFENACVTGDIPELENIYGIWSNDPSSIPKESHWHKTPFDSCLTMAALNDQAEVVEFLIHKDIGSIELCVGNLLMADAAEVPGRTSVLEVILASGRWDINKAYPHAPSMLGDVVQNEDLVRWFLDHGALADSRGSRYAISVMMLAARKGSLSVIKLLHEAGASLDGALHEAAGSKEQDRKPIIQYLLEQGTNPNEQEFLFDLPTYVHWASLRPVGTPLHSAIRAGNDAVVEMLIKSGAIPEAKEWQLVMGKSAIDLMGENGMNFQGLSKEKSIQADSSNS